MQKNQTNDELTAYRRGRLTILQLMAVLATVGILATWVLKYLSHLFI